MRRLSQPVWLLEQCILADLIRYPNEHAWELSGVTSSLWSRPAMAEIAAAMCRVRDSGHRVSGRTVRSLLRGEEMLARFEDLMCAPTTHGSMTVYMSELVYLAAARRAA